MLMSVCGVINAYRHYTLNYIVFLNVTETVEIYTYLHTRSLHDALPIFLDNPQGHCGTDKKVPRIDARTAMAERVHEPGVRQAARRHAHLHLKYGVNRRRQKTLSRSRVIRPSSSPRPCWRDGRFPVPQFPCHIRAVRADAQNQGHNKE